MYYIFKNQFEKQSKHTVFLTDVKYEFVYTFTLLGLRVFFTADRSGIKYIILLVLTIKLGNKMYVTYPAEDLYRRETSNTHITIMIIYLREKRDNNFWNYTLVSDSIRLGIMGIIFCGMTS